MKNTHLSTVLSWPMVMPCVYSNWKNDACTFKSKCH